MNPAESAITRQGEGGNESDSNKDSQKLGDQFVALILGQREHLNNGGIELMLPSNFHQETVLSVIRDAGIEFNVVESICKGMKRLVVTRIRDQ
jgi:hypothetical protein